MFKRFPTLHDSRREFKVFKSRLLIIAIIVVLLTLILLLRLGNLQLFQHQVYTTLARQNLLNLLPIEPNRGLIYDRNGVLLAENVPVFELVVIPDRVNDLSATIKDLQKVISISDDDLRQFYRGVHLQRHFQPVILRSKLTEDEVAAFSVQQYHFPGVSVQAEMIRHYPLGPVFAQVVGYVGRINGKELAKMDPANYSATNYIGKTGIEKFYETALHGVVGNQQVESDASGKVLRTLNRMPAMSGANLYLTIDSKLQMAAEQALGDARGAVVAINPNNGEILALVSNPSYDPNLFAAGISKTDFDALQKADGNPLFNRAVHGTYPPGSTIKPFIALGALATGTVDAKYSIFDPGWFKLPDSTHIYHDDKRISHGVVNIIKAVMVSCDTYFYNLAVKLGIARLDTILQGFGFGNVTGIDETNESKGILPSPEWKKNKYHQSWYPGDTVITGIGQGYMLVTPLQLASATATLANHGQGWQPHVLLGTHAFKKNYQPVKPIPLPPIKIDEADWETVLHAMEDVVESPSGTAFRYFQGVPYSLAAKTGTAQVFSLKNQKYSAHLLPAYLRDNSMFIVFAPADHPQIALAVTVQNGSVMAAKVARDILDYYFGKTNLDKSEL